MKPSVKTILAIIVILIVVVSIPVAVYLIRQRQEIREKAAVPTGQATVSLSPTSATYDVGQSFNVGVSFNTANIAVSAVAVRLTYPYSGTTPELTASNIQINPSLLATGSWSCPVKTVNPASGTVQIDIACVNTDIDGFTSSTDTQLASFSLVANQVPASNPTTLRFDSNLSVITQKSDGQDVLLIPTSTGSYTISGGAQTPTPSPTTTQASPTPSATPTGGIGGGATATPTPTPTGGAGVSGTATPTPTKTPTPTPTGGTGGGVATATPTKTPTPTPTSTSGEELPDSGISAPFVLFGFLGLLFLVVGVGTFSALYLKK